MIFDSFFGNSCDVKSENSLTLLAYGLRMVAYGKYLKRFVYSNPLYRCLYLPLSIFTRHTWENSWKYLRLLRKILPQSFSTAGAAELASLSSIEHVSSGANYHWHCVSTTTPTMAHSHPHPAFLPVLPPTFSSAEVSICTYFVIPIPFVNFSLHPF